MFNDIHTKTEPQNFFEYLMSSLCSQGFLHQLDVMHMSRHFHSVAPDTTRRFQTQNILTVCHHRRIGFFISQERKARIASQDVNRTVKTTSVLLLVFL